MYTYNIYNNRCTITFTTLDQSLLVSISKLTFLPAFSVNTTRREISFIANNICSFHDYIDTRPGPRNKFTYNDGLCLATTIGNQIFHLEQHGYTFAFIDPKHIVVVNNKFFLYLGQEHIVNLSNKNTFFVTKPNFMEKNIYIAPEYKKIHKLPTEMHMRAVYYSLALVIIHSLFPDKDIHNFHINYLMPIVDTKLYWFLIKCTDLEPSKRVCTII